MTRTIEEGRRARRRRQVGRPTAAVSERRRSRAVAIITANPAITRSQLAHELDVDPDTARRIRRVLEEAGLVPEPPVPVEVVTVPLGRLEVDRAIAITGADSPRAALEQLVRDRDVAIGLATGDAGRAAADQAASRRGVRR